MKAFVCAKESLVPWFVGLFFGVLLAVCFAVQAHAADKVKNSVALSSTIQSQGTARVIVKFAVSDYAKLQAASLRFPGVTPGMVAPAAAGAADKALASGIASGIGSALQSIDQGSIEMMRTFKTIPFAVLRVDAAGLHALEDSPAVLSIEEDAVAVLPDPVDADNGEASPQLSTSTGVIGADQAWAAGYDGSGWYVAILDTGILNSHEFFAGKDIVEACYTSKIDGYNPNARLCPNGEDNQTGTGAAAPYPSTNSGYEHGTHVAGIAAGHLSDDSLNGVAKGANIIAVNVFSNGLSSSSGLVSFSSDQILGLEYVYSLRNTYSIAAVNMSLGGGQYYATCDDVDTSRTAIINNLRDAGIATVIASGNNSWCDSVAIPACISTAPAVGATNNSDVRADFSNWRDELVPLFAPGVSIYSSLASGDDAYGYESGTSMATPHVCGAWAILKQKSNAGVDTILNALTSTGAAVDFDGDCSSPSGINRRISVMDALNALAGTSADQPDILWRNPDNGKDVVWYMNGTSYSSFATINDCPTGWEIVGTGDFDQDGNDDIVWRQRSGERTALWYMDNTSVKSWTYLDSAPTAWKLRGVGDFNADSNPDFVWRNPDTGSNCIWYMTNATRDSIAFFDSRDAPWDIAGVGDFNSDSKPDLLWRNSDSGDNDVWFMDNTSVSGTSGLTNAGTDWNIAGVGDFNTDGNPDILWRWPSRSKNVIWIMNGTTLSSVSTTNDAASPWDPQGVGVFH